MKQSYVYLIATALDDGLTGPVKVGVSDQPTRRLAQLQSGSPHKLKIAHLFPLPNRGTALEIERALLGVKAHLRMSGEWLDIDPLIAASLIGLYIGTALVAAGVDGDDLDQMMSSAHALPSEGEFKLNLGNI